MVMRNGLGTQQSPVEPAPSLESSFTPAANPQIENGYLDVANELVEILAKTNLSKYESRILWALWRKTWGWHKKEDRISITQFQKLTGLKRRHVSRTLSRLVQRNIITKRGDGFITTYAFQKDYTKWKDCHPKRNAVTNKGDKPSPKRVTPLSPKEVPTKEIFTKETITKEKEYSPSLEPVTSELAILLFDLIRERHPKFKSPRMEGEDGWPNVIDKMIRLDKRAPEEIEEVIRWCQKDDFWQNNILSAAKLRLQFDQLFLKMKKGKPSGVKKQDGIDRGIQKLKDAYSGKPKSIEHKPG